MVSPLVVLALAALPTWQADGPKLEVGIICSKGEVTSYALQSAQKSFAPGTIVAKVTPRAASGVDKCNCGGDLPAAEKQAFDAAMQVPIYTLRWARNESLPQAYAAIGALARSCNGVVVDQQLPSAMTAATWQAEKESPRPAPVGVGYHYAVFNEPAAAGELRVFTRGLARLGLAELSLAGIHASQLRSAASLLNVVVQRMTEGLAPGPKGELVVRLDDIVDPAAKARQLSGIAGNAKKEVTVKLSEKGEISFPRITCSEPNACLEAAFDQLFGSVDEARRVQTTDAIEAATARARTALAAYKPRVGKFPGREYLLVKGPFVAKGTTELMWVEVKEWKDGVLKGPLRTQPSFAVELVPGQTVTVKEAEVIDYSYKFEDGTFLGNETGRARYPESFEATANGRFREKR